MSMDVTPIKRQAISELVAQQLLGMVQAGNLKPGEKFPPERELAETLGVSRPSLREALRALSLLGVVNIRQGGGVYVSALDPESLLAPLHFFIRLDDHNMQSLFEARILIESGVAALAASRISDEQITRLKACTQMDADAMNNAGEFIKLDLEFHEIIFAAAGNSFLSRVAKSLQVLGKASREVTAYLPGVLERSVDDHRHIYNALRKHDADQASAAMKMHLCHVRDAYQEQQKAS